MPKLKKRIKNKLINKRIYIIYKNYIEYNRFTIQQMNNK